MYRATLFGSSEVDSQSSEVCDNESICFNITDLRKKKRHLLAFLFYSLNASHSFFFFSLHWICRGVYFLALWLLLLVFYTLITLQNIKVGGRATEVSLWPLKTPLAFLLGKFALLILLSFHYFSHKTSDIFSLVFFKFLVSSVPSFFLTILPNSSSQNCTIAVYLLHFLLTLFISFY